MSELEFTGERVVPGKVERELWEEHVARYHFAGPWTQGRRVLDFGCGAGYGLDLFRRAGASFVLGCDLAVDAVSYARSEDRSAALLVTDCQSAALRSDSFDVVVSFEVIEHVPDFRAYLDEAKRLLTPDGIVILSTPNKLIYTDESLEGPNPFHLKEFYFEEFREVLAEYFPTVVMFGQSTRAGQFFAQLSDLPDRRVELLDPSNSEVQSDLAADRRVDYFLALCSQQQNAPALQALPSCFAAGAADQLSRLKTRLVVLQAEFDERSRWATALDEELAARCASLQKLQTEFEERTEWALELEATRRRHEERIAMLEQELAQRDRLISELKAASRS